MNTIGAKPRRPRHLEVVSVRRDALHETRESTPPQGLIAIFKDDYFAITKGGLLFADFSAWGAFFLILGAVEILVGFGIPAQRTWSRVVGVIIIMLNTITQFAFIAAFPIWTLASIVLNISIIFALMKPLEPYEERRGYIE